MAGLMDAGLLPTIKCSNCGMSVEISEMGDHLCKPAPAPPSSSPSLSPPPPPPKSDREMQSHARNTSSGPRRPGPPPRIDPSLANRPFIHTDERLSRSEKDSLTPSPLSVSTGQRSPFRPQPRIRIPLLDAPDSPEVIKPVGDLPAFPLPRSMSRKRLEALAQLQSARTAPPVPSSPFANAMAEETDRRSHSARPSSGATSITQAGDLPPSTTIHHRSGESIDSRSSYGTSGGSSRYGDDNSKRSTTMSSRRPSLGSIAQDPLQFPEEFSSLRVTTLEPLVEHSAVPETKSPGFSGFDFGSSAQPPSPPSPPSAAAAAAAAATTNNTTTTQVETDKLASDPLRVSSHTQSDRLSSTRGSAELFFRSPSQSSFGLPTDWLEPADARSSSSSTNVEYKAFRPSGSNYPQSAASPSEPKDVPVKTAEGSSETNTSVSKFARALGLDLPGHTADNSTSSSDSSLSEARSGTSLSSLPSEASLSRRKMSETSGLKGVTQDLPDKASQQTVLPASNQTESPIDLEPPRIPEALFSPDSPTDPAINQGSLSLVVERTRKATPEAPSSPIRPTIARSATEPPVRPPPRSKGRCRGCGEAIVGKSVSSKDGRLTGRYHRECFVCCHCRSPFETADFYVLNDRPYCAQHYHQLNGSLCSGCNKGIEGQYLETDERMGGGPADCQKFHPECLTCRTCWIPLKGEYFEWNGRVYCERDARRAAASTSSHRLQRPTMPSSPLAAHPPNYPPMSSGYPRGPGPGFGPGPGPRRPPGNLDVPRGPPPAGRRFPERRTTRLMMT